MAVMVVTSDFVYKQTFKVNFFVMVVMVVMIVTGDFVYKQTFRVNFAIRAGSLGIYRRSS